MWKVKHKLFMRYLAEAVMITMLIQAAAFALASVAILFLNTGAVSSNDTQSSAIVIGSSAYSHQDDKPDVLWKITPILPQPKLKGPTRQVEVEAEPMKGKNPYVELNITDTEKELLACMAYEEARGESFEGQVAVVQVALNRYLHKEFNGSITDILTARHQFSVGSTYGVEQMDAVEEALAGNPVLDLNTDVVFFSTGKLTCGSYYKTIGGHVFRTYS